MEFYLKGVSGAVINTATDTPLLSLTPPLSTFSSDLKTLGDLYVKDTYLSQGASTIDLKYPTASGSASTFRFLSGSGDELVSIDSTGGLVAQGTVTSTGDMLAMADVYVAGDSNLYGDMTVAGEATLERKSLLMGANGSGGYTGTGLYVGNDRTAPVATFTYNASGGAYDYGDAWVASAPVVYTGSGTSSEVGDSISVYSNDRVVQLKLNLDSVEFSRLWRIRFDMSGNRMLYEYRSNVSGTYQLVHELRPPS